MNAMTLSSPPRVQETLGTWVGRLVPDRMPALGLARNGGPVSSAESGSHAALFEGELYNRAQLLATLGVSPEADDAALVLSAYRRWGVDVLREIKGIFALAIWDGDADRALLAHDPMATYPLFYADLGHELLFSSSIDSLLGCEGVSKSLNRAALADHLCHRWPDREATYFEAVRRIPPCHALLVERGTRRLHRYWDPAPPGEPVEWIAEEELDRFGELFDQAVSRALGLGPVGIFLSGGFDSVSVAAVAADNCRSQGLPAPLALSVAFPHPDCNEEDVQRAVAKELGLDQLMKDMDDAVQPHGLLQASCVLQEGRSAPMLSYFAPPYLQLAHAARERGYNAVLTGGGGDEWLCVTPLLAADLIRHGDIRGLIRHARSMQRSFNLPARDVWRNALWVFGLKQLLGAATGTALRRLAPGRLEAHRRGVVQSQVHDWVAPDAELRGEMEQRNLAGWPERPTDGWYLHDLRNG
ncbi:MAG: asparagine synthetase B family protein, partial [Thermoleophilaceae bacterium]